MWLNAAITHKKNLKIAEEFCYVIFCKMLDSLSWWRILKLCCKRLIASREQVNVFMDEEEDECSIDLYL